MKPYRLILAAGAILMAAPSALATGHNVCTNNVGDVSDPFGIVGVDDPFTGTDVILVCLGTEAYGGDVDVYAGPSYGATVRVVTCSGLTCTIAVDNTGAVVGSGGLVLCVDDPTCP